MDYFELELARREEELDEMRQAEREENRFLLVIIAILAGGAGAALMMAGAALLAMLFVLSYPGITNPAYASVPAPAVPLTPTVTAVPTVMVALPSVQAEAEITETPTALPPEVASDLAFASGGLGMSKVEWESMYGSPIGMVNGAVRYGADNALTLDVVFRDDMVQSIDWQSAQPMTADAAVMSGQTLLPADAREVSSYAPPEQPTAIVTIYHSDSFAQRLGDDPNWWQGSEPGTMLLEYDLTPAGVSRLSVSTGSSNARTP